MTQQRTNPRFTWLQVTAIAWALSGCLSDSAPPTDTPTPPPGQGAEVHAVSPTPSSWTTVVGTSSGGDFILRARPATAGFVGHSDGPGFRLVPAVREDR